MPLSAASAAAAKPAKATIVLVHGAWADSSSWDGVISKLHADGYTVIAAANPLRSLKSDASYVSGIVSNVKGPVVLVGHSYGGSVITNAATGADNIKALVYVAAYAPDNGESVFDLTGKFPGSIITNAFAAPIALAGGAHDLYIQQSKFRRSFAADVPEWKVRLLAATQRPVTDVAAKEASGARLGRTFLPGSSTAAPTGSSHQPRMPLWRGVRMQRRPLLSRALPIS